MKRLATISLVLACSWANGASATDVVAIECAALDSSDPESYILQIDLANAAITATSLEGEEIAVLGITSDTDTVVLEAAESSDGIDTKLQINRATGILQSSRVTADGEQFSFTSRCRPIAPLF